MENLVPNNKANTEKKLAYIPPVVLIQEIKAENIFLVQEASISVPTGVSRDTSAFGEFSNSNAWKPGEVNNFN